MKMHDTSKKKLFLDLSYNHEVLTIFTTLSVTGVTEKDHHVTEKRIKVRSSQSNFASLQVHDYNVQLDYIDDVRRHVIHYTYIFDKITQVCLK